MKRIAWTKFQDFYLRLGFLNVLAAVLSAGRRSVSNDAIIRRLRSPLFDPATRHPDLWADVESVLPTPNAADGSRKGEEVPTVAEALLISGDCPSLLFAITGPTAYKILDWGRDVELIGRGNQITERGLLLRHLLDADKTDRFLSGVANAWNPFHLSLKQRLFLLYHLAEIDGVIVQLIDTLGQLKEPKGDVLEASHAARVTCRALLRVLEGAQEKVPPGEILKFRTACDLARTIAEELNMLDEATGLAGSTRLKPPKPVHPSARRNAALSGKGKRKTTKNADHQTVPRFEQLVDLGFLSKPTPPDANEEERLAARKRWLYTPTDVCRRWAAAAKVRLSPGTPFLWNSFAGTAVEAFQINSVAQLPAERSTLLARYVWRAYEQVHRRVGANPLDSIALFAMLDAVLDGVVLEMAEIHRFMLFIRQQSLFSEHAFFSSGNDLDQMFIQLKPGFAEQVESSPHLFRDSK